MEEAKNKEKKQPEKTDEKEKDKDKGQQPSAKDKDKKEEQELVSFGFFPHSKVCCLSLHERDLLFCLSHCGFDNMVVQAEAMATRDR